MPLDRDAAIEYAIPKIRGALMNSPEGMPNPDRSGHGTVGAWAVGADIETAVGVNNRIHTNPELDLSIGGSEYLAGAVLYLTEVEPPTALEGKQ